MLHGSDDKAQLPRNYCIATRMAAARWRSIIYIPPLSWSIAITRWFQEASIHFDTSSCHGFAAIYPLTLLIVRRIEKIELMESQDKTQPTTSGLLPRPLLYAAGWGSLGLGAIGVVMPIMPTAPFLLVSVACFAKSSPAMHRRILELPVVGHYLEKIEAGDGISERNRWAAISAVGAITIGGGTLLAKTAIAKTIVIAIGISATISLLAIPGRKKKSRNTG